METTRATHSEEKETARTEAFSDGVFAIAITLLILDIKIPTQRHGLGDALFREWPWYFAYLTSFATIGIMWLNHHMLFNYIRRVNRTLLVLNLLLLLGVSIVPFPTALLAEHLGGEGQRMAAAIYSGTFVYIAIAFNFLWRYATSAARRPTLLRVAPDDPGVRAITAQYKFGPLFYVAALILSFVSPPASLGLNLALAALFALPPRAGRAA